MFKHYITIALRHLIKDKLYSAINIIGLATGFASCVLIMLFVRYELSYDKFWTNTDTIGRVNSTLLLAGRSPFISASAPVPMKEVVESFFADEVVRATRFIPMHPVVTLNGKVFAEDMHWTDPETAEMFDLTVLRGDIRSALNDKTSLAISEAFAEKYFGNDDPIGRIVNIKVFELERDYRIGAVFKDLPDNTSLTLNALAKFDLTDFPIRKEKYSSWIQLGENLVYIQLKNSNLFKSINDRLPALINTYFVGFDALKPEPSSKTSDFYLQTLQPLKDIHLNPAGIGEMKPASNIKTIIIFIIIAGLVLVIACINFINLVTAKSTQRAREVGLRKVLGADKKQLITQFIGETVVLSIIGLVFGLVFVELSLPLFNDFLNTDLMFAYDDGLTLIILACLVILTGFVAGFYPALILSEFLPAQVLKANKSTETTSSITLRKALVIVQFSISIALIVATATVYGQTWYATHKDPGYNHDNVLVLNNINNKDMINRKEVLKQTVLKLPNVTNAGFTDYSPTDIHERLVGFQVEEARSNQTVLISSQSVDYDFLETYKIPLLVGRFYNRDFLTDGMPDTNTPSSIGSVVINRESVKKLGLGTPEAAIGKYISAVIGSNKEGLLFTVLEIIGVTPNFYFQSPKRAIRAEVYFLDPQRYKTLAIKYDGESGVIVNELAAVWEAFTNTVPFQYEFVEDSIVAEFKKEKDLSIVLAIFSTITVLVACLGLYGLAAFTAERRTKEIGIRRILGAGIFDIVQLMIWQFSKPVLLANLIALPFTAWAMMSWLETYPYRLDTWLLLPFCLGAGIISLIIAWATISIQTVKIACTNPIKALRYE